MNRFIYEQQWTEAGKVTEADFSKLYLTKPDEVGPMLTYLYGKANFENSIVMKANANKEALESWEYQYKVKGSDVRLVPIETTTAASKPGIGFSTFDLVLPYKHFVKGNSVYTQNKYELRVDKEPEQLGKNWKYTFKYFQPDANKFVPLTELAVGMTLVAVWTAVTYGVSSGNDMNMTGMSMVRGNIGVLRKSLRWNNNIANKEMTVELPKRSGGTTKMFWNYMQAELERQWQSEKNNYLWYSKSSRAADGTYPLKDDSGEPIINGDGLLEQIGNKDTYGRSLTTKKLNQIIRDMFNGIRDQENKVVTLRTGRGGMELFDRAIKDDLLGIGGLIPRSVTVMSGDKFIQGSGYNMKATGFFAEYDHIDGYTLKVVHEPAFDYSEIAQNSPKDPTTGLLNESYRMVFLDESSYDGQPNIKGYYNKNVPFSRSPILGVGAVPPGFPSEGARSTEKTESSLHYIESMGISLRRWNTSLDLQRVYN